VCVDEVIDGNSARHRTETRSLVGVQIHA
jgi:hypothetical protein